MPLKYILSRTCTGFGTTFRFQFYNICMSASMKVNYNKLCFSVEQIKFIFITYDWLPSIGKAIEILFVKNQCRVKSSYLLQFYDIDRLADLKMTNNNVCYTVEYIKYLFIKNYWLRSKGSAIEILFGCAGSGRLFGNIFMTFFVNFFKSY